jgi:uncharacterized protein (TIGR03790 family)
MRWSFAVVAALAALPGPAAALGPQDIVILYNKNLPNSKSVADYYCQRRGVPTGNLVPLDLPDVDEISRADYESRILAPVRAALKDRRPRPRVLLTVYGIPLRVGEQPLSDADKANLDKLKPELESAEAEVRKLQLAVRMLKEDVQKDPKSPLAPVAAERESQLGDAQKKVKRLEEIKASLSHRESTAAVDSELMLLWWRNYPLSRWVVNPLYWQISPERRARAQPVMMTCRLDAQTPAIAKRLVDDAIAAEQKGLSGRVYIDARGIKWDQKADPGGTGYGGYDESFREAARLLDGPAKMDVVLENTESLFEPNSCPNCALYCGWYALQNYRPCCRFVQGAVAWHLASLELTALRNPGKQWAGNLLRDGAAATLGPVAEPYTIGFPRPEEFFGFLVTGEYTLVECYARSTFLTSWVMCLIGDPLYNPYAKSPKLKSWEVLPSPLGAAKLFGP